MGGADFPPCWLFGLRQPNTGAYMGSLVGLMTDSGRVHTKEYFPELLLPVCLSPPWATATPRLCRRSSNTSRLVWFSFPWGHCSFPWVLMCTLLCVCPPRVESLFPPVLSKSCNQIPLTFKVWFSRNSSSHCQTPRLGSLMWGSEPSLQWVDFCGISVLQSVSHPPNHQLWDLILLWWCPSYRLIVATPLCLDVGYLLWWVLVSSFQWLSRSLLWFWCSHKGEWDHVLLLHHLVSS